MGLLEISDTKELRINDVSADTPNRYPTAIRGHDFKEAMAKNATSKSPRPVHTHLNHLRPGLNAAIPSPGGDYVARVPNSDGTKGGRAGMVVSKSKVSIFPTNRSNKPAQSSNNPPSRTIKNSFFK